MLAQVALRETLSRLARLGGGGLAVWNGEESIFCTVAEPGVLPRPELRRSLVSGGLELGFVAPVEGAVLHEDALETAAQLLRDRLASEEEQNALTGEILGKLQELSVLYDVASDLSRARDLPEVADAVLGHAMSLVSCDWAGFVSYDAERSQARLVRQRPERAEDSRGWRALEQLPYTWEAMNSSSALLLPRLDKQDRDRLRRELGPFADEAHCLLAVPMAAGARPVGALLLVNGAARRVFTSVDAKLLTALAAQAAVSTGHLRLLQESKEMFHSTVWALASAIDAKDAYTHGHSQRVARYASALGRSLGFDALEIERLELSSVLHDIGKIGVPEVILNKEGRLTPTEMSVMRSHPEKGASILGSIRALRDVLPGVLHHHERWDGLGYPDGLKGENIPLNARIILIADTFDAMTSTRPYREGLPVEVALAELERCSGTQFDGRLTARFVQLFAEGRLKLCPDARPEGPAPSAEEPAAAGPGPAPPEGEPA